MKSINKYLNEGFFSNVGGSIDSVKKLLAPILEMNNPNRRKNLNREVIYDVLVDLPKRFVFNIYKYNRAQTEVIESIKAEIAFLIAILKLHQLMFIRFILQSFL